MSIVVQLAWVGFEVGGIFFTRNVYFFSLDGVLFLFFYLGIFYFIFFLDDVGVPRGGRY